MIPSDFLQTTDGDLDFSQGLRRTPDLATYTAQKISQVLNFIQGEDRLDQRKGIPWPRYTWGRRYDAPLVDLLFRRALLACTGVASVVRLAQTFHTPTRSLETDGAVRMVTGETVPFKTPIVGVT